MRNVTYTALVIAALAVPAVAHARGGGLAVYHPKPCSGDACKADDPRAESDCKGWLCSISSAKAMQRPVTTAEAAAAQEAARAKAAAEPIPALAPPEPKVKRRVVAKVKAMPAALRGATAPAAASAK